MSRWFTIDEARALVPEVHERAAQIIGLRSELVLRRERLDGGAARERPEVKALEARLHEAMEWFGEEGIQVKGWAPLLIDFPMRHRDRTVLLCWLENEPALGWWHDEAHGFMGRRPLSELD